MAAKGQPVEKPKPIGDRVYKRHRSMLEKIGKKLGLKKAETLRFVIEDAHERHVKTT